MSFQKNTKEIRGFDIDCLPLKYQELTRKNLKEHMVKHGFEFSETKKHLGGSSSLQSNSALAYRKHYRGLYPFAAMVGDYDAMLMLGVNKIKSESDDDFCPSMKDETVVEYMRYKSQPGILRDRNFTDKKDVLGEVIQCANDWNDPGNLGQFLTAVTSIHKSYHQTETYQNACSACHERYSRLDTNVGCKSHVNNIRVWRTGNPRSSDYVQATRKELEVLLCEHHVRGAHQFTPGHILKIRLTLLASGELEDLQIYCVILVASFLFLRYEEFHGIQMRNIVKEYSQVTEQEIHSLCLEILGKSDKNLHTLLLYSHKAHPLLCPIRHLLAYVHLANIKGTTEEYLFPQLNDRAKPIEYNKLLQKFKSKCQHLFPPGRDGLSIQLTLHCFRKTAYLLSIWGGGHIDLIKQSARHRSQSSAQRYIKDASATKFQAEGMLGAIPPEEQVPAFKPCLLTSHATSADMCADTQFTDVYSLSQLMLRRSDVPDDHPMRDNVKFICDKIVFFDIHGSAISNRLERALDGIEGAQKQLITALFFKLYCANKTGRKNNKLLLKEMDDLFEKKEIQDYVDPGSSDDVSNMTTPVRLRNHQSISQELSFLSSVDKPRVIVSPVDSRHSQGGRNEIPGRHLGRKRKSAFEVLAHVLPIYDKLPGLSEYKALTKEARFFVDNTCVPIVNCYRHHCEESREGFANKWQKASSWSRFASTCCDGTSEECMSSTTRQKNIRL